VRDAAVRADENTMDSHSRFFGIFRSESSGLVRRIDIVVCAWLEYPFALMSWTGSRMYNRYLRLHAQTCGMTLGGHLLYRHAKSGSAGGIVPYELAQGVGGVTLPDGVVRTERDIFALLGLPYVPTHARNA
jgi:DNA polymerase mu